MNSLVVEKPVNNLANKLYVSMWVKIVDKFGKMSFPYKYTTFMKVLQYKSTEFYTVFSDVFNLLCRRFYTFST